MESEGGESSRYVLPDLNVEWKPTSDDEVPENQDFPPEVAQNGEVPANQELSGNGGLVNGVASGSGGPRPSTGFDGCTSGSEAGPSTSAPVVLDPPEINPPDFVPFVQARTVEVEPDVNLCSRLRQLAQNLDGDAMVVLSAEGLLRRVVYSIAGIRKLIEGPLPILSLQGTVREGELLLSLTMGEGYNVCGGRLIGAMVHQIPTKLHYITIPGHLFEED